MTIQLHEPSHVPYAPADPSRGIAVLMSGGVDSSVAAWRLRKAGWDPVGLTMRVPLVKEGRIVPGKPLEEAAVICASLGIPHYYIDVHDFFCERVIAPFQEAYRAGQTPNPCVDCNRNLKFGALWDLAESQFGIQHLATGHYAAVVETPEGHRLRQGAGGAKDQTYFLYRIPRERLPFLHFPLHDLEKSQTRALANEIGLDIPPSEESMEICFAGGGDYRCALPASMLDAPGNFLDIHGQVVGQHKGLAHYTIGQRKIGVALKEPHYVLRMIPEENAIVVGTRAHAYGEEISAHDLNLHTATPVPVGSRLLAKSRSVGAGKMCTVMESSPSSLRVGFDTPVFAPTPGQHLVLYDPKGHLLEGGRISSS